MKTLSILLILLLLGGCATTSETKQELFKDAIDRHENCIDKFMGTVGRVNGRLKGTNIEAIGKICQEVHE